MRVNYWSCSKFADWLRGTPKMLEATGEEWQAWRKEAKSKHKFRYWLAETGLNKIQNFVNYPLDLIYNIKYYINNRWVTKTHALTAHRDDIKPGEWCDVGNRFLLCLFNELVDFVEIEQAWHHVIWDSEERKKYKTPWWAKGWFRIRSWRCPEAGIAYLNWARTITNKDFIQPGEEEKPTSQAIAAEEILKLYTWWKIDRTRRIDPYVASGWNEYWEMRCELINGEDNIFFEEPNSPELAKLGRAALDKINEIEQAYEQEDEEMLIRLIKVRKHLWT